ncbi:MAG: TonB-dependent receptor plug domain-containing protein [Gammaproteobacteria bacterium]|nr:TonB-dependent receptor plug domain-containing protein [Gammaproteobacteria bacterium]
MFLTRRSSLLLNKVLFGCWLVFAWQTGFSQEANDSTVRYPASYFAQYDVVTVNDMLNLIPGIALALNSNGGADGGGGGRGNAANRGPNANNRGLGGASQILIDGKRMAGKENEAATQLDLIAANQVEYIEIIRGASGDLDVSNSGQLINIVLLEAGSRSSFSANLKLTNYQDGAVEPGGSLAYSAQFGRLSYLFSIDVKSGYEVFESIEHSINGDASANDRIDIERITDLSTITFNGNLNFDLNDGDSLAINMLYSEADPPARLVRQIQDFNTVPATDRFETERIPSSKDNWEFGVDYEHRFDGGGRFKLLSIINDLNNDTTRERFVASTAQEPKQKSLFLDSRTRTRERIVRSSYTWNVAEFQTLELGIERAQTILDSSLKQGLDIPGIPASTHGGLVPISLPIADSSVEEIRYEGFIVHNWQINARHTLESSFLFETSEITQTGDVRNQRDFSFPKPKFSYRFDINQSMQFRASVEKFIRQLSFADFSANSNNNDDDQDVLGGNPDLVQEESLRFTLNLEYRLPQDGGVLNSRLFYYDFENTMGRINSSSSLDTLKSVAGNVGDGRVLGLDLDGSIRFGFIGVPAAILTAGVLVQESKIKDPVIGRIRKVQPFDRGNYRMGFRHDVTSRNFNYGFNYRDGINNNRPSFDIDRVIFFGSSSDLTVFFETKGFAGLTYRFEANNILDHERCNIRKRYDGLLIEGVLNEIEENCSQTGRQFSLQVRGSF